MIKFMISAELSYRNYVPIGWFALEYSNLLFHGNTDLVYLLGRVRDCIQYEKSQKIEPHINKLEVEKKSIIEEYNGWKQELDQTKKKYPFWRFSKEHREEVAILIAECDQLGREYNNILYKIKFLEDDRFYSASEKTHRFKKLLSELGFLCKSTTRSESNLHEEVYESTCSDEELMKKAQAMFDKLKQQEERNELEVSSGKEYSIFDEEDTLE